MSDKDVAPGSQDEHETRVHEAFDAFHEKMGARLEGDARMSVENLREAAVQKDAGKVRERMGEVRERHSWLYRELAEHPAISTLLDELALWGF
jgi:hypothetical protein